MDLTGWVSSSATCLVWSSSSSSYVSLFERCSKPVSMYFYLSCITTVDPLSVFWWSCHMRTCLRPNVPTMQYGRVACYGVVCISYICEAVVSCLQEIGGQSKWESAVYPCGLSRQTPRLSVDTGWEIPINWDDLSGFVHRKYFKSLRYWNLSQRLHVLLLWRSGTVVTVLRPLKSGVQEYISPRINFCFYTGTRYTIQPLPKSIAIAFRVQWNPSNADTVGPSLSVEMSIFQRLPIYSSIGVAMCTHAVECYKRAF